MVLCLSLSGTHSWLLSINGASGSHYCFDVIWCTEFNFPDGSSKQEIKIWWSNHANAVNIVTEIILLGYKNRQKKYKEEALIWKIVRQLNSLIKFEVGWMDWLHEYVCVCVCV